MERTCRSCAVVVRAWCGERLRRGVDNHKMTMCVPRVRDLFLWFMQFLFNFFFGILYSKYTTVCDLERGSFNNLMVYCSTRTLPPKMSVYARPISFGSPTMKRCIVSVQWQCPHVIPIKHTHRLESRYDFNDNSNRFCHVKVGSHGNKPESGKPLTAGHAPEPVCSPIG